MRSRPRTTDKGETLVELLVSIALLGVAALAILASITMGLKASALASSLAQNQNVLRNWAEVLEVTPYVNCATSDSYPVPLGLDVPTNVDLSITDVKYWDPATSTFLGTCGPDNGTQQLTLEAEAASGANQPSVDQLIVVLRKPCESTC